MNANLNLMVDRGNLLSQSWEPIDHSGANIPSLYDIPRTVSLARSQDNGHQLFSFEYIQSDERTEFLVKEPECRVLAGKTSGRIHSIECHTEKTGNYPKSLEKSLETVVQCLTGSYIEYKRTNIQLILKVIEQLIEHEKRTSRIDD